MTGSCWLIWGEFGNRTVIKLWWYVGRPQGGVVPWSDGMGAGEFTQRPLCSQGHLDKDYVPWLRGVVNS